MRGVAAGGGLLPGVRTVWGRFLSLLKVFASCEVQAQPSLPFLEQPKERDGGFGLAGIFSFCAAVPQNVLNYPEKASQRQRGKALGYSGCCTISPPPVPAAAVSVSDCFPSLVSLPCSQLRCTDGQNIPGASQAGQPPPQKCFLPDVPALLEDWAGEGSCWRGKQEEMLLFLPTAAFTFFPTQPSILVGRKNCKIHSEGRNKVPNQPTTRNPFPYGRTA